VTLRHSQVPFREEAETPDEQYDGKRLELVRGLWRDQDDLLIPYHRQVEENVRFLAGQQWSVFHPVLNRWVDVTEWMTAEERQWRQRPVFNRLLPWFIITHARATENAPIVTFEPGPDRADADLAEVLDTVFKAFWRELGMADVHDAVMAWVVAAGRGHIISRLDPAGGPMKKWVGRAALPLVDQYGQPIQGEDDEPAYSEEIDGVPFDHQGNPLAVWTPDGPMQTGEPHEAPEGSIRMEVLSPLQVRGSWGPTPWHQKDYHQVRTYLTPERFYEATGIEAEPDVSLDGSEVGEIERILYGGGFYGSQGSRFDPTSQPQGRADGLVEVTQTWFAGSESDPGGRYICTTRSKVVHDGPREVAYKYTSPVRSFEFVRLPGRGLGTTPLEGMLPAQRGYNEGFARIREHVNLSTNPIALIDAASGIKPGTWTNAPGRNHLVTVRPGVRAVEFVAPPQLGADVYRLQEALLRELEDLGNTRGTEGAPPSDDPSGELVKELRFNTDRHLGPMLRRAVAEYARLVEDWKLLLPLVWDEEKIIRYNGEDNVAKTVVAMPELFRDGNCNAVPDVESMLPEGRGERQAKVYKLYMDGLFGPPGSPVAVSRFFELARFPHMSRTAKPGGVHRVTAEQENGLIVQGAAPQSIPVFPWYDHMTHLLVHETFMASPEFLKQPPEVQDAFVFHRQAHLMAVSQMQQAAAAQQMGAPGGGPAPGGPAAPAPPLSPPPPAQPEGAPGGGPPTAPAAAPVL
jgi:hypothetical protein